MPYRSPDEFDGMIQALTGEMQEGILGGPTDGRFKADFKMEVGLGDIGAAGGADVT